MNNSSGGIGFCGILTIVFIVLKLLRVIDWNWLAVFMPLIIPCVILFVLIIAKFILLIKVNKNEKHRL